MQRRTFHKGAVTTAVLGLFALVGCGGGGGGSSTSAGAAPGPGTGPVASPTPGTPAPPPLPANLATMGTNFAGMEWAAGRLRVSPEILPNEHFSVPRAADVTYMATQGFGRNRLPIQWELLQPMLSDTPANAQARALIGEPGAFNAAYAGYITAVFDAHAAVGARCILDLHNYCRYRDFRFQPDGSVIGLAAGGPPLGHAYTTDPSQVWTRICATAPGASITTAALADFWSRAAALWKDHPGFGGYGLMNEPHDMPRPGETVESTSGEDLMIWPAFARAAIAAIRAVDPSGPIYVSGNAWGGAMSIGPQFNPAWPLAGDNLVYEVHAYLDAWNSGTGFDWDVELREKDYVAGVGPGRMTLDTGVDRMRIATDWARANGQRIALTEAGMPIDDPRWEEAFRRMVEHTRDNGVEMQSWMGGSHWQVRNFPIHHTPGWHQNRTLEPQVAGPMKAADGIALAAVFDDGPGSPQGGGAVTITVYVRGHLERPLTLTVASDNGGAFSKTTLVIPAGANGQDSYSFTPGPDRVTTLSYASDGSLGGQVPPPRKVYSLADPVAHAAVDLATAAMALIARYGAGKWDMADGHTDFVQGWPAGEGEAVRAVADSGFASSPGNAMEMLNWFNQDGPNMGALQPPVMRGTAGRRHTDHTAPGSTGLWCKKAVPEPSKPNPRNRAPYDLQDPHFVVAAVRLPGANSGVVFQASMAENAWYSELAVRNGQPQARWRDRNGQVVELTAAAALAPEAPAVLSLVAAPGSQQLRVNGSPAGSAGASLASCPFGQMLIGFGFLQGRAVPGFGGHVYGVIAGRGSPSAAELAVLEQYAASLGGA
ncbi:glycoside hydrolase family 5 protein [Ramlibacter tataouinensis]|uniref:Candidate endo-1,4-glucanase, Glycoside Hydrolase Family 5 n=1 Tax=Ramlibacter tataouinensis (strain ATCC BAA-407 / DSM 14655 / LMG 21543 / TTB310) TaxID=365046 RepID=F5XWZ1_RAMTT|nr:cellulase family glycosylhydrolase [Ramlibacter tataouinensis]AEG91752.1 candidate endo-1,4-glucanase, Glycoside Hydrolase Family 5 [Ramlibacter tataouinensis TTB310]